MLGGLLFIVNGGKDAAATLDVAFQAINGGADMLQWRYSGLYTAQAYDVAAQLSTLCRRRQRLFFVNDRADIAAAVDADGVHLGRDDLPIEAARKLLGSRKLIGLSTATLPEVDDAHRRGADYVGFGPLFPSTTKPNARKPLGAEALHIVCQSIQLPLIAIGGINVDNIGSVCHAGPHGVAIAAAIAEAPSPEEHTRRLKRIMDAYNNRERTLTPRT